MEKHAVTLTNLWDRIKGQPKDELFDVVLEVATYSKIYLEKCDEL